MKFAPIVPIPMFPALRGYDYHMVLAGQLGLGDKKGTTNKYTEFYRNVSGFKILDNGAAEGESMEAANLVEWAHHLGVDEVIAPDVMYDARESISLLKGFVVRCSRQRADIPVMAVLQGRDEEELAYSIAAALSLGVESVALPKLLTGVIGPTARLVAAATIREINPDIPIHCLGCGNRTQEVQDLQRQGIVRGIDSAAPVVMGLRNHSIITEYDWKLSHKAIPEFWDQASTYQAEVNLRVFDSWCRG